MAATARVTVKGRRWLQVTPERRALVLDCSFEILDPAPVFQLNEAIRYPPGVFQGMTQQQAIAAIRDNGIGGIPSLTAIALGLIDDWNASAPIRGVNFPIVFNP
jgi:hypothetical protein